MADELRIGLSELLHKAMIEHDADFLKEGVRVLSQALMEMEVEEHFYLVLPLLVWALRKRPRALVAAVGLFVLAAPLVRVFLLSALPEAGPIATAVFTPALTDALGLGVLGAIAVRSERCRRLLSGRWPLAAAAGVFALDLLVPSLLTSLPWGERASELLPDRLAAFYLCFILLAVLRPKGALARLTSLRPLVVAGTVAYGGYLLHLPLLWIVSYAALGEHPTPLGTALGEPPPPLGAEEVGVRVVAFALTAALALLSWHHFEKPLVRLGHQLRY